MTGKREECRSDVGCCLQRQWPVKEVLGWSMAAVNVGWAVWQGPTVRCSSRRSGILL